MESYDKQVEWVLIHGIDPQEHLADMTRLIPVKEGSRLTNDPLQVALAQHYQEHQRAIEHVGAVAQERLAYELVKKAEAHLQACVDHWNACQTRMHATAPRN
jgi:hypothetical protein